MEPLQRDTQIVLSRNERWVYCYDLSLKTIPDDADVAFELKDVIIRLKAMSEDDMAYKLYEHDTRVFRLCKVVFNKKNDMAVLLIQLADKNGSDPVFANLITGELRTEPKLAGEGIAVSAHLVISLVPTAKGGCCYVAAMEDVPGINKTKTVPFLIALIKDCFSGTRYIDGDTGREKSCRPTLDLIGHPTETLEESLEESTLKGITLIKCEKRDGGLDDDGYTQVVERTLKLQVVRQPESGAGKIKLLHDLKNRYMREDFTQLRVTYKRLEGDKQETKRLDKLEDAAHALFTKQELVSLDGDIKQCEAEPHKELCTKMIKLIRGAIAGKDKDE